MTRRVAVVGGGAAGTLAAVHLMREAGRDGVEVVLIDREGDFGPGVAYATRDPLHLLNVPAVRMGGICGEPEHFHTWLRRRGNHCDPAAFVSRRLFGDYLRDLLAETEARSAGRATLLRLTGEVTELADPGDPGEPLELTLDGEETVRADSAVLAVGMLPGSDPAAVTEEMRESGLYVSDPWAPGALDAARGDESVLVIGTGLTMVDVALTLERSGNGPTLRAISRNGLVPRRHRADLTTLEPFRVPVESGHLEPIIVAVVEQIGQAGRRGGDWRDVFDSMRAETPAIWRALPSSEKRRFLATLQRFWEVHRFRMAPEVADRFESLRERGRLRVQAASILALEPSARGVRATLRPTDEGTIETVDVDRVLNCTGAGADIATAAPPLIAGLIDSGLARPDELSLGLDVDPSGALIDAEGRPSERIHVVGCLRKGVEWEAIGVTEIREHAAAIAQNLFAEGRDLDARAAV